MTLFFQAKAQFSGREIRANQPVASYTISGIRKAGSWRISPHIERDTLTVLCWNKVEDFVFSTDSDSISFKIAPAQSWTFNVRLPDSQYAKTVVVGISPFNNLDYNYGKIDQEVQFIYGFSSDLYQDSLENAFPTNGLIRPCKSDLEKIALLTKWVHEQWKHSGMNTPKKTDPLSILKEAKAGGQFPCFAYAIVLRSKFAAAGYQSRVLYLKGKDVETNKVVPGHVVCEVFVPQFNKWVFVDPQFSAIPMRNNIPQNAVEFQKALTSAYKEISFYNTVDYNGTPFGNQEYISFVYPYLYFFDYAFDSRADKSNLKINNKTNLMLVPLDVKPPTKFGAFDGLIDYCIYTDNYNLFYRKPR